MRLYCLRVVACLAFFESIFIISAFAIVPGKASNDSTSLSSSLPNSPSNVKTSTPVSSTGSVSPPLTTTQNPLITPAPVTFPTTCASVSKDPVYWFGTDLYSVPYYTENKCRYDFCRDVYNSSWPARTDIWAYTRTTSGTWSTHTVNNTYVTIDGTQSVETATHWWTTSATRTLSSDEAWWAGGAQEPCCGVCNVLAGTINLRYWPPRTTGASEGTIRVENGYTMTYPSVYIDFDTIMAADGCKTIGAEHAGETFAFDPSVISSVYPVMTTISGKESKTYLTESFDFASFNKLSCASDRANAGLYGGTGVDSVDPCYPRIAIPDGIFERVDTQWATCITTSAYMGFYDPPHALQPQSGLLPNPTTEPVAHSTSPAAAKATAPTPIAASTPSVPKAFPKTKSPTADPSASGAAEPGLPSNPDPASPHSTEAGTPPSYVPESKPLSGSSDAEPPSNPQLANHPNDQTFPSPSIVIVNPAFADLSFSLDSSSNVHVSGQQLHPNTIFTLDHVSLLLATNGALYAGNTLIGSIPVPTPAPMLATTTTAGNSPEPHVSLHASTARDGALEVDGTPLPKNGAPVVIAGVTMHMGVDGKETVGSNALSPDISVTAAGSAAVLVSETRLQEEPKTGGDTMTATVGSASPDVSMTAAGSAAGPVRKTRLQEEAKTRGDTMTATVGSAEGGADVATETAASQKSVVGAHGETAEAATAALAAASGSAEPAGGSAGANTGNGLRVGRAWWVGSAVSLVVAAMMVVA